MTAIQARQKIINIAEWLCENATKIRYGSVSATLKIHNGRVIDVTHLQQKAIENRRSQNETRCHLLF